MFATSFIGSISPRLPRTRHKYHSQSKRQQFCAFAHHDRLESSWSWAMLRSTATVWCGVGRTARRSDHCSSEYHAKLAKTPNTLPSTRFSPKQPQGFYPSGNPCAPQGCENLLAEHRKTAFILCCDQIGNDPLDPFQWYREKPFESRKHPKEIATDRSADEKTTCKPCRHRLIVSKANRCHLAADPKSSHPPS